MIKEFLRYRKLMKEVNGITISKSDKLRLSTYDREFEKKINEMVIQKLIEMNFNGVISRDYLMGFREALIVRLGLIRDYMKENIQE